jgi:hypothetical protein
MEICVSNEDIKTMFSYVYNEEEEICANLGTILGTIPGTQIRSFIKDSISKGSKELLSNGKSRAYCKYKIYTSFIFHSHPKTSRSYPSYEDIEKVKKHVKIKVSIIATRWGIYVIKRYDNTVIITDKDKVEIYLNSIYDLENSTGFSKVEKTLGELTPNVEETLKTYIKKLGYYTGLNFSFYNWSHFNL